MAPGHINTSACDIFLLLSQSTPRPLLSFLLSISVYFLSLSPSVHRSLSLSKNVFFVILAICFFTWCMLLIRQMSPIQPTARLDNYVVLFRAVKGILSEFLSQTASLKS